MASETSLQSQTATPRNRAMFLIVAALVFLVIVVFRSISLVPPADRFNPTPPRMGAASPNEGASTPSREKAAPFDEPQTGPVHVFIRIRQVPDSEGDIPIQKINAAVAEQLKRNGCVIAEAEKNANAICEFAFGQARVNRADSVTLWGSTTIWNAGGILIGAGGHEATSIGNDMTDSGRMLALLTPKDGDLYAYMQVLWYPIRLISRSETAGSAFSLTIEERAKADREYKSWFAAKTRRSRGTIHVRWNALSREYATFQASVYRAIDDSEWQICHSAKEADLVLDAAISAQVGSAEYIGPIGGRLPTFNINAELQLLDRIDSGLDQPLQKWKIRGLTSPTVDIRDGTHGSAVNDLREDFEETVHLADALARFSRETGWATRPAFAEIPSSEAEARPAGDAGVPTQSSSPAIPRPSTENSSALNSDREKIANEKLKLAKLLLRTNTIAARKRLKEIVDSFDGTQAAKDAAKLLTD